MEDPVKFLGRGQVGKQSHQMNVLGGSQFNARDGDDAVPLRRAGIVR